MGGVTLGSKDNPIPGQLDWTPLHSHPIGSLDFGVSLVVDPSGLRSCDPCPRNEPNFPPFWETCRWTYHCLALDRTQDLQPLWTLIPWSLCPFWGCFVLRSCHPLSHNFVCHCLSLLAAQPIPWQSLKSYLLVVTEEDSCDLESTWAWQFLELGLGFCSGVKLEMMQQQLLFSTGT